MNPMNWRRLRLAAATAALAGALAYLHDPPWAGRVTSGLRPWEENPPGTFFRWTTGRASFFVPAEAKAMTLPLLAIFPGPDGAPVRVEIRVDDRFLANIELADPKEWVRPELPLGRARGHRHFRRIDLRVSRVVGERMYGVVTGLPTIW
jgi:hypothetical protein